MLRTLGLVKEGLGQLDLIPHLDVRIAHDHVEHALRHRHGALAAAAPAIGVATGQRLELLRPQGHAQADADQVIGTVQILVLEPFGIQEQTVPEADLDARLDTGNVVVRIDIALPRRLEVVVADENPGFIISPLRRERQLDADFGIPAFVRHIVDVVMVGAKPARLNRAGGLANLVADGVVRVGRVAAPTDEQRLLLGADEFLVVLGKVDVGARIHPFREHLDADAQLVELVVVTGPARIVEEIAAQNRTTAIQVMTIGQTGVELLFALVGEGGTQVAQQQALAVGHRPKGQQRVQAPFEEILAAEDTQGGHAGSEQHIGLFHRRRGLLRLRRDHRCAQQDPGATQNNNHMPSTTEPFHRMILLGDRKSQTDVHQFNDFDYRRTRSICQVKNNSKKRQ